LKGIIEAYLIVLKSYDPSLDHSRNLAEQVQWLRSIMCQDVTSRAVQTQSSSGIGEIMETSNCGGRGLSSPDERTSQIQQKRDSETSPFHPLTPSPEESVSKDTTNQIPLGGSQVVVNAQSTITECVLDSTVLFVNQPRLTIHVHPLSQFPPQMMTSRGRFTSLESDHNMTRLIWIMDCHIALIVAEAEEEADRRVIVVHLSSTYKKFHAIFRALQHVVSQNQQRVMNVHSPPIRSSHHLTRSRRGSPPPDSLLRSSPSFAHRHQQQEPSIIKPPTLMVQTNASIASSEHVASPRSPRFTQLLPQQSSHHHVHRSRFTSSERETTKTKRNGSCSRGRSPRVMRWSSQAKGNMLESVERKSKRKGGGEHRRRHEHHHLNTFSFLDTSGALLLDSSFVEDGEVVREKDEIERNGQQHDDVKERKISHVMNVIELSEDREVAIAPWELAPRHEVRKMRRNDSEETLSL